MKKFLFLIIAFLIFPYFVLASDKVEINTASLEQLDTLIGIGPTYAQRITDARPFSSVDDLIRVKGIGEKTLQKIKDQGLAYAETQAIILAEPIVPPQDIVIPTVYPMGIVFSKVLPSPDGPDTKEWFELYNTNSESVDLSGWKVYDRQGKTTTYVFPVGSVIKKSLTFKRADTKITLNNDSDGLVLEDPNGSIVDEMSYSDAKQGQIYGRDSKPEVVMGQTKEYNNLEKTLLAGELESENPFPFILILSILTSIILLVIFIKYVRTQSLQNNKGP
ncbi:helix-hairpin-helix domain-containing protein [Patescibacteria group bacterium]|nr:helix-hairpin-helix domain-containing protein [Patescibacteria group bacterium]